MNSKAIGKNKDEVGVCALIANNTVPSVSTRAELIEESGSERNPIYELNPRFYRKAANDNMYGTRVKVSVENYPQAIIDLAKRNGGFVTKEKVSSELELSASQAYFQIRKLIKDKTLSPNQKGKYANYKLETID